MMTNQRLDELQRKMSRMERELRTYRRVFFAVGAIGMVFVLSGASGGLQTQLAELEKVVRGEGQSIDKRLKDLEGSAVRKDANGAVAVRGQLTVDGALNVGGIRVSKKRYSEYGSFENFDALVIDSAVEVGTATNHSLILRGCRTYLAGFDGGGAGNYWFEVEKGGNNFQSVFGADKIGRKLGE